MTLKIESGLVPELVPEPVSVFCYFRPVKKLKSGFFGNVGILRSSRIRKYPEDVCRYPS